jgi:peptide subunit release factor 1 (eRF1)
MPGGMAQLEPLTAQLDRLVAADTGPFPVVSLYLNLQPDDRGRDRFDAFLRKELSARLDSWPAGTPERDSLEQDIAKIEQYASTVPESANGLAIFACAAADLFEAIPLAAPVDEHRLFISDQPHLYPLARLLDEYPRYVALLADTNAARIFVFAANGLERADRIQGTKTRRNKVGGWSQARYQRHIENYHLHHAKEIVEALAATVRDDGIEKIVIAGDEAIVRLLRDQLPKDVAERIVDVVRLDINAAERTIVETTLAALREEDATTDRQRVDELIGAYRGNGLACVGVEATRRAFELGQVDELIISATPDTIKGKGVKQDDASDAQPERSAEERVADELIVQARNTSARIRFIEDPSLLAPFGGVGAFLRFTL